MTAIGDLWVQMDKRNCIAVAAKEGKTIVLAVFSGLCN
jgi:hypothetical protein